MVELDANTKQELMDAFQDLYDAIESVLSIILENPKEDLLRDLFRSIHTIKGNAGICGLMEIVNFTHSIEEIAESLRSAKYSISLPIRNCIQLGMDRLYDIHKRDLCDEQLDNLREEEFISLFHEIGIASSENVDEEANKLIEIMSSGVNPKRDHQYPSGNLSADEISQQLCLIIDDKKRQNDLFFFQELCVLTERTHPSWNNRSIQLFEWAHKINVIGGKPVNYEQLSAAIYMHDIGHAYLPEKIFKPGKELSNKEIELLHLHPVIASNHLEKIPGWEEAARIVLQHQEHVNGSGYPNGVKDQDIHPGAKILLILDAFFDMTNGGVSKTERKSVVRAVSQINAGINSIFDGLWVQCFNHMIRKELQNGVI